MKSRFALVGLTMLFVLVFAMFCTGQAETNTRVVTDMRGVEVEIPATVDAYVETWASHNTIDFLLDSYEHMVMTGVAMSEKNWVWRMNENIKTVAVAEFSAEMNLEEVIALQPDIVFGKVES